MRKQGKDLLTVDFLDENEEMFMVYARGDEAVELDRALLVTDLLGRSASCTASDAADSS